MAGLLFPPPALTGAGRAAITLEGGLVSARFDATAVPEALEEIRRATGLEVVVPPSVTQETLTLSAQAVPLERFVRRVMDVSGLGGRAVIQDPEGQGRVPAVPAGTSTPAEPSTVGPAPGDTPAGDGPPAAASSALPPIPLPTTPPAHAPPPVRVEPKRIVLVPQRGTAGLALRVWRPRGLESRQDFAAGRPAAFGVVDERGNPLPDGLYKYGAVVVPALSPEIRRHMDAVLKRVASLPLATWRYTAEAPGARHLEPTAEDFHAAFGLGEDDKHIAPLDPAGVTLAAIQERHRRLEEHEAEVQAGDARIADLEAREAARQEREAALQQRVTALEALLARLLEESRALTAAGMR